MVMMILNDDFKLKLQENLGFVLSIVPIVSLSQAECCTFALTNAVLFDSGIFPLR